MGTQDLLDGAELPSWPPLRSVCAADAGSQPQARRRPAEELLSSRENPRAPRGVTLSLWDATPEGALVHSSLVGVGGSCFGGGPGLG